MPRLRTHAGAWAALAITAFGASATLAQAPITDSLTMSARWPMDRFVGGRIDVELDLSRPLDQRERLALMIGILDVSSLVEIRGTRVRYRPLAARLPSGEHEVTAYRVDEEGNWMEIGRAPLRVLTRAGLESGGVTMSADLSSSGQLDQRLPIGSPPPDRRAYQDFTLSLGLQTNAARDGWSVTTHANAIAVTEEAQRLRFAQLQNDAPPLDLSDYRVQISRGQANLTLGNVSAGTNRLLVSGFGSRGIAGGATFGDFATLEAALMNGSNVVGWTNMLGMSEPNHRLGTASLNLELVPARPGALHIDVTGLDASVLPVASFNQGVANDAEESRGFGVQVAMSNASQRLRFSAGLSRSRFVNPFDPTLAGDTSIVPVRPTTRTARYGELTVQLLQNARVAGSTYASLGTALRHERADPLYRSIGAYVQPDVESNGVDVTGSLGSLSVQGSYSASRDNLDDLPSILTTKTRTQGLSASVPVSMIVSATGAWFLPQVSWMWQRNRQFGEGVPVNGGFSESHVPDQVSTNQSVSVAWSLNASTLTYRWNRTFQDNRQTGREQADFGARVHSLSLGFAPWNRLTTTIDASLERQKSYESLTTQRLERIGGSLQWQVTSSTALSGAVSHSRVRDPLSEITSRNTEHQLELSQGFNLYRRLEMGTQGRVFIRYSRTRAAFTPFDQPGEPPAVMWTLSAGSSFRLY